jgi:hypothetical protein
MQPSDLHYEKAEPVPGWDKSLWPERGRWRLNVRLARWSDLVTALLTALMVLALGGWITVVSLTELDLIVVPDFLAYRPRRANPWVLLAGGGVFALMATAWIVAILATMTAKAWQAARNLHPFASPDPDYRDIDFRKRHER